MKALSVCVCTASVRKHSAKKLPGELPIRSPRQSLLLPLPLPLPLLLLPLLLLLLASALSSSVTRESIHLGKKEAPTHPSTHPPIPIHSLAHRGPAGPAPVPTDGGELRASRRRGRGGFFSATAGAPEGRRRGARPHERAWHTTAAARGVAARRAQGKGGAKGTRGRSGAP